jgi:adenosylmethionine-8-amino-7-oxononanoate aminotransferase
MNVQEKQELLHKDRKYVWHPFTQMKDYENQDHLLIEKAEGIFLYDADGNQYYDTISSWWTNVHGHAHPRIRRAINDQMSRMDHVMFSGLTHPPGIELAEKLVGIAPEGLTRVFYSDNGSTAVEVAIKMSFQYWQHRGFKDKTKFVFMENSYHGDTIGAVSVGGVDLFHATFKPLLFSAYKIPSPGTAAGEDAEAGVQRCLAALAARLEASADEIAGIIVEPMIQAAGGMIIYPAELLRGLRELSARHGVHLIADEVAVGFGRTGRMFACEHAGISPDILCCAKGLTAGVMPLAATLCGEEIYSAFYDEWETLKTFFHGHSFTGNPLAAAVALENLRIFEDEQVLAHVEHAAAHLAAQVRRFDAYAHIGNVRSLGMIAAFDILEDKSAGTPFDSMRRMGYKAYLEGLKEGLILRPLGDTLYYWLPLCTTAEHMDDIIARTERVLQRLNLDAM